MLIVVLMALLGASVLHANPVMVHTVVPALPPLVIEPCLPDLRNGPSPEHWARTPISFWDKFLFPAGEIYAPPMANLKESRLATTWNSDSDHGMLLDAALGGRVALWRYGTHDAILPSGVQVGIEGGTTLRMALEKDFDMVATDYRVGLPVTWGNSRVQFKVAYIHMSSHLGDEWLLRAENDGVPWRRINYIRDSLVFGISLRPVRDVRLYTEVDYAFRTGEMTKPWHIALGAEYAPLVSMARWSGTPFLAIHGSLLQELNFSGSLCLQAGWQWRSIRDQRLRLGFQCYTGADDQFEFHDRNVTKLGIGCWYDF